jgi:hypothetical protein
MCNLNATGSRASAIVRTIALAAFIAVAAAPAFSQDVSGPSEHPLREQSVGKFVTFLGGAASALALHECGHLLFDELFDADPRFKKVHYAGIPFFAITHRADVSPRREFSISSAGFWMQHATSETILIVEPELRSEAGPFAKGMLAFNVLASVAYAGAALTRTGPYERDTRGMSDAIAVDERWIGVAILTPALLDAYRYFHPGARWARWASRGAKVGVVLLVIRN